ncbi:MAG: rhodanese-like domain-containing protein [Propionibacteriaceae bacterium]
MRSARAFAGIAVALALALAGCSPAATVGTTSGPTATAAPSVGAALHASDFAAALKRSGTVLIDVRTPAEFASGHLPGAINLDLTGGTFAAQLGSLAKDTTYALYCHSGNRSGTALSMMTSSGFTSAYHLAGGITAWTNAHGDTVT